MAVHNKTGVSWAFWAAFPVLFTVACVLLTMAPFGLSSTVLAPPAFALVAIYIWTLLRPDLLPSWSVFLIGIFQDLVSASPVGIWAFIFLMVHGLTLSQRVFLIGRGFGFTWIYFGIVASLAGFFSWILVCIYHGQLLAPYPAIVQTMLSAAIYPVFAKFMPRFTRRMAEPE